MPKIITEDMIEQAAIKALHERHNYTVLNCMTEEPDTLPDGTGRKDKKQVVLPDVMLESLCRINPNIPEQTDRSHGGGRVVSYSCFRRFNVDQLPELSEDP